MMRRPVNQCRRGRGRRGAILIVTMFVVFTLASLVLVMCGSMSVEAGAAANMAASLQASAVERGAEQYVIGILTEQKDTLSDLTEDYFAAVPVGDGFFWILRPDYGDPNLPVFGLTEEAGKLNINTADYDALMKLPNMTDDVAAAIVDWRDADSTISPGGAESEYYGSLPDPYNCKNAPFESVEELLLVRGVTRDLLYGNGTASPLGTQSGSVSGGQASADLQTANGWYNLLTCYSSDSPASGGQRINLNDRNSRQKLQDLLEQQLDNKGRADAIVNGMGRATYIDVFDFYFQAQLKPDELSKIYDSITVAPTDGAGGGGAPTGGGGGTTPGRTGTGSTGGGGGAAAGGGGAAASNATKGLINVNTAPRDVLLTLPGLEDADVDKLISARQGSAAGDTSVGWVADALDKKAIGLGKYITGKTSQFSADILAVSGNGRAFKRCRIVVNTSGSTPQIVYRRDLTERGWPMDPEILAQLRTGQAQGTWAGARSAMPGGFNR